MKLLKQEILNYVFILLGSFAMAFGLVGFLSPNHIATGGTAGLAIVLNHISHVSVGLLIGIVNIPLLLVGAKYLGKRFTIKTIICIFFISLMVYILEKHLKLPQLSTNLMLATLYGGICVGVGLGLIFKGGASAGGGTILAKIISAHSHLKTSTIILILDTLVIIAAGLAFNSIELALWSLISIYVGSKLIDNILIGAPSQKIVHISSDRNLNELSKMIKNELGISGTIIQGNDIGEQGFKDIIFIMIDKTRLNALKQLVSAYDPNVKMIVMEATEVLGNEKGSL